ncbi:MAG TPA: hypothetical protein VGI45_32020 [Terracidiphilus sp.]
MIQGQINDLNGCREVERQLANRYRLSGRTREIFLHLNVPASRDDESNVTEIQVPLEKA